MNMIHVLMPQMGESLTEGTVVRWLKAVGEAVGRDEPLVEISTDKVDTEVPSPVAGVLRQILAREGETVAVSMPVAVIEPAQTGAGAPAASQSRTSTPAESAPGASGHFGQGQAPGLVSFRRDDAYEGGKAEGSPFGRANLGAAKREATTTEAAARSRSFSPAVLETARRRALSLDVLTGLVGSGRGGRITKRDVEMYLRRGLSGSVQSRQDASESALGAPGEYVYLPQPDDRRLPMSPVRRKIAHHMSWSVRISPHATAFAECDMSRAGALLAGEHDQREADAPLTYTAIFARTAVRALADFPSLNASIVGDELVLKRRVHLGIAVALPDTDDLIVPVIRSADELSLAGMARALHALATRARDRTLKLEEVQGGSFTVTNPGIFGGLGGTPILNQPQVAILGLGAVVKRAVVINDAIAIRPTVVMSLTFDHRAADGMVAFRYLARVRDLLETVPTDPREAAGW